MSILHDSHWFSIRPIQDLQNCYHSLLAEASIFLDGFVWRSHGIEFSGWDGHSDADHRPKSHGPGWEEGKARMAGADEEGQVQVLSTLSYLNMVGKSQDVDIPFGKLT